MRVQAIQRGRLTALALLGLAPGLAGQGPEEPSPPATATVELTGRVLDASTLRPIHGAYVGLVDEDRGILTDLEGRFRLRIPSRGQPVLSVSELGYDQHEVAINLSGELDVEIQLEADPVQLGEIRIMVDRFSTRRRAAAVSARVWERGDLLASPSMNMLDYLRGRTGRPLRECPYRSAFGRLCVMSRGRLQAVQVYLDEMPVFGGLEELRSFRPHELFMVEVYNSGRHIRLYSTQFMDRLARTGLRLNPIPINE